VKVIQEKAKACGLERMFIFSFKNYVIKIIA
jgi:hypothetical protein